MLCHVMSWPFGFLKEKFLGFKFFDLLRIQNFKLTFSMHKIIVNKGKYIYLI